MHRSLIIPVLVLAALVRTAQAQETENTAVEVVIAPRLGATGYVVADLVVYGSEREAKIEMVTTDTIPPGAHLDVVGKNGDVLATFRRMPVNCPIEPKFRGMVAYALFVENTDVASLALLRFAFDDE